jgi:hypothetical protein
MQCDFCNGTGFRLQYSHIQGGICFPCGGEGKIFPRFRLQKGTVTIHFTVRPDSVTVMRRKRKKELKQILPIDTARHYWQTLAQDGFTRTW